MLQPNYTGNISSFEKVIYAAGNVPVLVAGGPLIEEEQALNIVRGALSAGAAGICFGRNFFYRDNIPEFIEKVSEIIDEY